MTDQQIIPSTRPHLSLVPFNPEPPPPEVAHWPDAYRLMEPLARAIPLAELLAVNIDMESAITTALGTADRVQSLRQAVQKQLPTFDISALDRLMTVARAAGHAHISWLVSDAPRDKVVALSMKCQAVRWRLHEHVTALAGQGVVFRRSYHRLMTSTHGFPLAKDLSNLTRYLRISWDQVGFQGLGERRDIERAEALADERRSEVVSHEWAQRDARYESTELRRRFFTLLVRDHEEVRRAVTFVRWHQGDAHHVAPALFVKSRSRRRRDRELVD